MSPQNHAALAGVLFAVEMRATWALTGGILKILIWAYMKYCQCIWQTDCICQLQFPATNTAYLVGFWRHRKLITICVELENVANCPMEFRKICGRKTVVLSTDKSVL